MNTQNVLRFSANVAESQMAPDFVWDLNVAVARNRIPVEDTYELGCKFHRLLRRIGDHDRLDKSEKQLLPWLDCVRDELRRHGVTYLEPEVRLHGDHLIQAGVCDLLVRGGLAEVGVAETKVVALIPRMPKPRHLLQVTRYTELLAQRHSRTKICCALIYLDFARRHVRIFVYRDCRGLRNSGRGLLAA